VKYQGFKASTTSEHNIEFLLLTSINTCYASYDCSQSQHWTGTCNEILTKQTPLLLNRSSQLSFSGFWWTKSICN